MKKLMTPAKGKFTAIILAILLPLSFVAYALQPLPSSTGTTYTGTGAENITTTNLTATSANVTTLTAANTVFTSANITTIKTAVAADNTLSGTPIIITVYDVATNTPYYFKAYPTKH
jgi:hypothetical protein